MSVTTRSAAGKEDEGRYRLLSGNLPPFNPVGLIWVLMSESSQGSDGPVMPVFPVLPVIEGIRTRPAVPPRGTIFSLGWLMAELFDPRRRVSAAVRQSSFDADVQLPQVPDLGPDAKLVFLAAELKELVWWYRKLASPAAAVTGETDKLKAAVAAESVTLGEAAADDDAAGPADGGAATAESAAAPEATGGRTAFSAAAFLTAVSELNQAILDEFADTPERLSAYQLGLALSDLTWLPRKPEPGAQGVGRQQAERARRPVLAYPAGRDQDAPQRGGLAAPRVGRRDREPVAR